MKRHLIFLVSFTLFLIIVASIGSLGLVSSGCGGKGSGSTDGDGEGNDDGGGSDTTNIETNEVDLDTSDSLSPSELPTVIVGSDGNSALVYCASGATSNGVSAISCSLSGDTYYVSCDDGSVMISTSSTAAGTEYGCITVSVTCTTSGFNVVTSPNTTTCSEDTSDDADGGTGDQGGDDGDNTETETVTGSIALTDSLGYYGRYEVYYDLYTFDGLEGDTIEMSYDTTRSSGSLGSAHLYRSDDFDPNDVINNDLIQITLEGTKTATLPYSTNYTIGVWEWYYVSSAQVMEYTLTWTITH